MVGRKPREPLPKGKDAEAELQRQRRNERRALRRAKRRAEENGEEFTIEDSPPPPVQMDGVPDAEALRAQFWAAYAELGGHAGLVQWGRRYPKEFYAIWARLCLPKGGPETAQPNSLEAMLSQLGDDDD